MLTTEDRAYLQATKELVVQGRAALQEYQGSFMGKMAAGKVKKALGGASPEDLLARIDAVIAIAEKSDQPVNPDPTV